MRRGGKDRLRHEAVSGDGDGRADAANAQSVQLFERVVDGTERRWSCGGLRVGRRRLSGVDVRWSMRGGDGQCGGGRRTVSPSDWLSQPVEGRSVVPSTSPPPLSFALRLRPSLIPSTPLILPPPFASAAPPQCLVLPVNPSLLSLLLSTTLCASSPLLPPFQPSTLSLSPSNTLSTTTWFPTSPSSSLSSPVLSS